MSEIYARKADLITHPTKASQEEGLDLMGAMIRSSGLIPNTPNHGKAGAGLSQSEIMGNSFVLFLAGHETAANSIHFAVLFLATRPDVQKKLQGESLSPYFPDTIALLTQNPQLNSTTYSPPPTLQTGTTKPQSPPS